MASVMVSNLLPASVFRGPQHEIRGRAVERQKEHIVESTLLYWEKMRVKCDGDRTDVYGRELVYMVWFTLQHAFNWYIDGKLYAYGWIIGSGRWWQIYVGTVFYTGLCIYVHIYVKKNIYTYMDLLHWSYFSRFQASTNGSGTKCSRNAYWSIIFFRRLFFAQF